MNKLSFIAARTPSSRAASLADLLAWHDADFVRCAFVTVLARQPDAQGEAYYTDLIRQGRSKLDVLWRLRRSPEGLANDPGIAGFDRALKRAAWGRRRFLGAPLRMLAGIEGDSPADRTRRATLNAMGSFHSAHLEIMHRLNALEHQALQAEQESEKDPFAAASCDRARDVAKKLALAFAECG